MKILDVGDELPALKRSPGLSEWKVPDRQNASTVYASFQDVRPSRKDMARQQAAGETGSRVDEDVRLDEVKRGLMASMFPPDPPRSIPQQNLSRAVRILPHLQVCTMAVKCACDALSVGPLNARRMCLFAEHRGVFCGGPGEDSTDALRVSHSSR